MPPPPSKIVLAGALLLAAPLIAFVNLWAGLEFSFSLFYVIPPVLAAWFLGARVGSVVALATGLGWAYAESITRVASVPAATWNRGTRVLVLMAFTYLIALVHRNQDELRRLLAQRDEFLSLVAHELRAPVAAIDIVATALSQRPTVGDAERVALDRMRGQARNLTHLAESLLSVGRLEAGVDHIDRRDLDVRDIVISLANGETRLEVTTPTSAVVVSGDDDVLRRALQNIVDNALKFSTATVQVTVQVEHATACLRIVDHGIGFEPVDAERIFRKYGRASASAHVPGVGLGLYFTRLAIEAHGGTVVGTSAGRGSGATFEVRLPLAHELGVRGVLRVQRHG